MVALLTPHKTFKIIQPNAIVSQSLRKKKTTAGHKQKIIKKIRVSMQCERNFTHDEHLYTKTQKIAYRKNDQQHK